MEPAIQALIAAVASFIFVSSLLALAFFLCRAARTPKPRSSTTAAPPTSSRLQRPRAVKVVTDESATFDPSLDQVSMSELAAATKNFASDAIVGDGSFGFVYKARLSSGAAVAVKRLSVDAFHGFREFRAEMETLGRIRHPNLARMLGYCATGNDRVLIYEFLEGGSLDQWLYGSGDESSGSPLGWATRLGIVKGVAKGLAFLHEDCRPIIIHRDIKASNVLLDGVMEARIADFGLARRMDSTTSHVSTQAAGTMGYMAPEYRNGATKATAKADVYSFGALMIEVVARSRPSWPLMDGSGREICLVRWTRRMVEEGRGLEVVEQTMKEELTEEEEVQVAAYMEVAYRCTEESSRIRPTMGEVVDLLNQL